MDIVQNVADKIARTISSDYEGLWAIASYFSNNLHVQSDSEIKDKTLAVAQRLMQQNIMPGNMDEKGGFAFWAGSPAQLLTRISAEWPQTGIPSLASGTCWFALKKT